MFPPAEVADDQGLVAVGGDLSPERLLAAYAAGIFPWPVLGEGYPHLWWSPDPRFVLMLDDFRVSRSLQRTMRRGGFEVRYDTAFNEVIAACAESRRPGRSDTWITDEMAAAYRELHRRGFAHSVEAFTSGELVGGLYGVALGGVFFGESMFSLCPDASKVALVALAERLRGWGFDFIDCQQETAHLARFGAQAVPIREFLARLRVALELPSRRGSWT